MMTDGQATRIRWRQLQAFKNTMSTGTVNAAAELLGVSQPAVSRLLEALETELKFTLFNRSTGRLVPTIEARIFYEEVQQAFISYDRLSSVANDIRSGRRGSLHIACMPAVGLGFLPKVIGAFARTQPDVKIRYDLQLSPRVEEWVSSQQVDLGIAEFPFAYTGFHSEDFCRVPYVVALPPDHPLAASPVITPRQLEHVRIVSLSPESAARQTFDLRFFEAGIEPQIVCETLFSAGLCALVQQGLGVGMVDLFTAHNFAESGLVFRRFEPEVVFHVGLLHPHHIALSRSGTQLLATMRQQRNLLLQKTDALLSSGL